MAITSLQNYRSNSRGFVSDGQNVVEGYVAGPASYDNGTGFAADILTDFGLPSTATVDKVQVMSDLGATGKWASNLIIAYDAFEQEVTDTDNLSAHTFYIKAWISE